jgi:hypothetical protein
MGWFGRGKAGEGGASGRERPDGHTYVRCSYRCSCCCARSRSDHLKWGLHRPSEPLAHLEVAPLRHVIAGPDRPHPLSAGEEGP